MNALISRPKLQMSRDPPVGENLGTPDVEVATLRGGVLETVEEQVQHIGQGDGLGRSVRPFGTGNDPEAADHARQHLEGRAACSHNEACAQRGDGHAPGAQCRLDFEPASQMRREHGRLGHQAAARAKLSAMTRSMSWNEPRGRGAEGSIEWTR